ncbi:hypothetical protein BY996DRAFT_7079633, partial [Phakopsora pachyrhizi]
FFPKILIVISLHFFRRIVTHTGERPYSCPVSGCGKAFTTASNAKRHAKTHYRVSHNHP